MHTQTHEQLNFKKQEKVRTFIETISHNTEVNRAKRIYKFDTHILVSWTSGTIAWRQMIKNL